MSTNSILEANLQADSTVPLYFQLVSIIKRYVSAGMLSPGDLLPSEAELCTNLGISRSTVRQAIGALEEEGLVVRKQGRGTFVAEPKMRRRNENVYSFTSEITAMGLTPSSTLIEFDIITPPEDIMKMFSMTSNDKLFYRFTRIRRVDGAPLMLETSFYPQYIYPNLTRELAETHSIYSLLYDVGIVPASAIDSYEAVKLTHGEAELLGCKSGSAGFFHQRQTMSENGETFEFTQSLIRGDRTKLEVVLHKNGVTFSRTVNKA
jgi:GntR family transcriptional regulator